MMMIGSSARLSDTAAGEVIAVLQPSHSHVNVFFERESVAMPMLFCTVDSHR